jgi:hypothetical protein
VPPLSSTAFLKEINSSYFFYRSYPSDDLSAESSHAMRSFRLIFDCVEEFDEFEGPASE